MKLVRVRVEIIIIEQIFFLAGLFYEHRSPAFPLEFLFRKLLKMYASEELFFSSLGNQGQVSSIEYLFDIWRNMYQAKC